jgi:hypothetical protein
MGRRGGAQDRITTPNEGDQAALDRSPLDEDVTVAGLAAQPDVRSEPVHEPRVAAAWMGAAEPDEIAEVQDERRSVGHRAEGIKDERSIDPGRVAAGRQRRGCP